MNTILPQGNFCLNGITAVDQVSEAEKERVDVRRTGAMAMPPFAHR
jgi:hypothetical protein